MPIYVGIYGKGVYICCMLYVCSGACVGFSLQNYVCKASCNRCVVCRERVIVIVNV